MEETVKAYALHKKRLERRFLLEKIFRDRAQVTEEKEYIKRHAGNQFRLLVDVFTYEPSASKRVRDVVSWPDGWWQALKDQYAPRWFLRRWPVRRCEKVFEHTLSAHIVVPDVFEDRDVVFLYEFDGVPLIDFNEEEVD